MKIVGPRTPIVHLVLVSVQTFVICGPIVGLWVHHIIFRLVNVREVHPAFVRVADGPQPGVVLDPQRQVAQLASPLAVGCGWNAARHAGMHMIKGVVAAVGVVRHPHGAIVRVIKQRIGRIDAVKVQLVVAEIALNAQVHTKARVCRG